MNKIYQIYYNELSKSKINSCFIPYDNTGNGDNEYEVSIMRKIYEEPWEGISHKSVLSWKFEDKFRSGYTNKNHHVVFRADQFRRFVDLNSSCDFISANPFPSLQGNNVWSQGQHCHGDIIIKTLNEFTSKTGLGRHWLDIKFTEKTLCFCNYFSANKPFWDLLMEYHEKMYPIAKKSGLDKNGKPLFPYVMERLLPCVLHDYQDALNIKVFKPIIIDKQKAKMERSMERRRLRSLNKSRSKEIVQSTSRIDTESSKPKKDKNLVVQIFFDHSLITNKQKTHTNHNRGPLITSKMKNHRLFKNSQHITRKYAEKCGADYVLFDKPVVNFFSASMERMRLIEEEKWAEEYDNILYIDCDVIISDECPNLFEEYPQKTLRVCPTLMSEKWLVQREDAMVKKFGKEKVCNQYFNGGVILFHKTTLDAMRGKLKYRERFTTYAFDDQSELNWIAMENNIPMTMMSKSFNSKPAPGVMITHYLGTLKTKYDNDNMSDIDIDLSRISGNKPKVEKKNSGLAILRCSEINQQHLWGEGEESCHNEFIVCRDESLNLPHVMKGNVLYVKSDREKFEYNMFKAISTLTELKKNTHFAMVDINQNRSKYFDDINLQKLRQIHAAGESLRFKSTSKEPFIISRRTISYCKKSGPNRDRWRAKIANEGIEIFNFDYLKSP